MVRAVVRGLREDADAFCPAHDDHIQCGVVKADLKNLRDECALTHPFDRSFSRFEHAEHQSQERRFASTVWPHLAAGNGRVAMSQYPFSARDEVILMPKVLGVF